MSTQRNAPRGAADAAEDFDEDPRYAASRRELWLALAYWVLFTTAMVTVAWLLGGNEQPSEIIFVLGFPTWFFWSGIVCSLVFSAVPYFTLGFLCMGPVARLFYPNLEVGDLAVPEMMIQVLPDWFAGVLLAAPLAAVMSTVDSMILIVSAAIVRDLYKNYVQPGLSDARASSAGSVVSFLIGVVVLLFALSPPNYLEYLIIFAIGGLEAVFFVPLLFGLYWKRGNTLGAILGMVGGFAWYAVATQWAPEITLGMFPIATSAAVATALYLVGSYIGPPPRKEVLVKFWGTQQEIDRVLTAPPPASRGGRGDGP